MAKAATLAGANRDGGTLGLFGVKAVRRRERTMRKRMRASHVFANAREQISIRTKSEMINCAWLAVGGAHSSDDE